MARSRAPRWVRSRCSLPASTLAVHDKTFQLDGDTSSTDINPVTGVTRAYDWNDLYDTAGASVASPPSGFSPSDAIAQDFSIKTNGQFDSSDGSTFTTGAKDTLDISSGWRCVGANNVTNKGDITNAYATQYIDPGTSHKYMYFGMEKYAPQGTNNVGIWFLQDKNVGCTENGSGNGNAFSGNHMDGDLLIVSAFDSGGKVSTILAYSWQGGALQLETPQAGVDCRQTPVTTPTDKICGAANQAAVAIKWPHASNADGPHGAAGSADMPAATFFEGGIDLNQFPSFEGKCFTKFIFDTRSATTTTASLYDYALGNIDTCASLTIRKKTVGGTDTFTYTPSANLNSGNTFDLTTTQAGDPARGDHLLEPVPRQLHRQRVHPAHRLAPYKPVLYGLIGVDWKPGWIDADAGEHHPRRRGPRDLHLHEHRPGQHQDREDVPWRGGRLQLHLQPEAADPGGFERQLHVDDRNRGRCRECDVQQPDRGRRLHHCGNGAQQLRPHRPVLHDGRHDHPRPPRPRSSPSRWARRSPARTPIPSGSGQSRSPRPRSRATPRSRA